MALIEDQYWQGQTVLLTATLTNPAAADAPTDDSGETMVAYREDNSLAPVGSAAHPSTGVYTAEVTADQPGHWEVNDGLGGVYRFYVKPIRQPDA